MERCCSRVSLFLRILQDEKIPFSALKKRDNASWCKKIVSDRQVQVIEQITKRLTYFLVGSGKNNSTLITY